METRLTNAPAYSPDEKAMRALKAMNVVKLGNFGEAVWRRVFGASGIIFISLSKIDEGGAPLARGGNGNGIILPDFDCTDGDGDWRAFVDSKCKTQPVLYRIRNQIRHGINWRNYCHYVNAAESFRKRCAIAILELFDESGSKWSGSILVDSLRRLPKPERGFSNQAHMCYWPRKMFVDLYSFSPAELFSVANGGECPSFVREFRDMFGRPEQGGLF